MDAPLAANSGHQGTAMALAPLAHVLFSRVMKYDPSDPHWPDRDRFILSNGHASILQYTMLFLSGSGLELDDLRNFRQWESRTPGHPEAGHTAAVEVTTGPLGQGFGNSVGMAIAERSLRTRFGAEAQDHFTYVIAGDGCMMEGISHEAASLAGHLGLGRLICVFDDNRITIDGATDLSTNDDIVGRFRAYNWDVVELGDVADDLDVLEAALLAAKEQTEKPSLLVLRTHIGRPSPDFEDDHAAHGNPFKAADVTRTKAAMGIPDEPFWAPAELLAASRAHAAERGAAAHAAWTERSSSMASFTRVEGGLGRHGRRLAGTPISPSTNRAIRWPLARRSRRRSTRPTTTCPASCRAPPTSAAATAPCSIEPRHCPRPTLAVATSTSAFASTRWRRRWSAWPSTAESCRSVAPSSSSPTT